MRAQSAKGIGDSTSSMLFVCVHPTYIARIPCRDYRWRWSCEIDPYTKPSDDGESGTAKAKVTAEAKVTAGSIEMSRNRLCKHETV